MQFKEDIHQIAKESTDKIQQAIAQRDWEHLTVFLKQRQDLLELFFSRNDLAQERNLVADAIKKIQEDDAIFLQALHDQKKEVEKQILALMQGRKSVKAYQNS